MLKSLKVRDFALIREAEIEFSPGLNLITGETGAGKSLLVGALKALLGNRLSTDVIRLGADRAVIEGEFELESDSPVWRVVDEEGAEPSHALIIRREINRSGRARNFFNDSPLPVKKLVEISDYMVDLCGQHDQQTLMRRDFHLEYLDRFAGLTARRDEVSRLHNDYRRMSVEIKHLQAERERQVSRQELIDFEIREIESANPGIDEEEGLLREEKALQHGEQILEFCHRAEQELSSGSGAVLDTLANLSGELEELVSFATQFRGALDDIQNASASLAETVRVIVTLRDGFDFSPERLEWLRDRLGELSRLKRKYGGSIASALEHLKKLKLESKNFADLDGKISAVSEELKSVHAVIEEKAAELSRLREEAVPKLKTAMESILGDLGFTHVNFEVRLERIPGEDVEFEGGRFRLQPDGIDLCEIYISTNPGEPPMPLKNVASGGEISRILLALKSVIAGRDKPGTLVFDEIDIGISGRVARKVGLKLSEISGNQQALVITHLPQIASLPGRHFSVVKILDDERMVSKFNLLEDEERVKEIAKLLAAGESDRQGEDFARELLSSGKNIDLFSDL